MTLKGVPEELLAQLKREASEHRRSLNGEVLHRLEKSIESRTAEAALEEIRRYRIHPRGAPLSVGELKHSEAKEWLQRVREIRDSLGIRTTVEEIIDARDFGRK